MPDIKITLTDEEFLILKGALDRVSVQRPLAITVSHARQRVKIPDLQSRLRLIKRELALSPVPNSDTHYQSEDFTKDPLATKCHHRWYL